ncbi:NrsF family protein [Porphyrobacter sp. AAP60]|uniref:NrsF family protein n=1 Tax=Porphyrobacter sp. AAP60 TaxID=1523423 RepID=UPI0006B95A4B|nr:DUF1109 domain-containing protein [Porphyrobacter sp. AAP60]KPF63611.1 hypothetical protein IP79_06810 [Porphyrobacter sp. AAP60]
MVRNCDVLIAELAGGLEPVKPLRFAHGMAITLIAAAVSVAVVIALFGMRPDLQAGMVNPVHLIATGLFLGLAVAASVTVIVMSRPCVGSDHGGWRWAAAMAALLPAAGLIVGLAGGGDLVSQESFNHGLTCFAIGSSGSVLVLAILVWWLRKGAPTAPDRAGLVTGIAAGSFGIFAFSLHCPESDIVHIGVWHSAVVLSMGAVGRAVVPLLVRW